MKVVQRSAWLATLCLLGAACGSSTPSTPDATAGAAGSESGRTGGVPTGGGASSSGATAAGGSAGAGLVSSGGTANGEDVGGGARSGGAAGGSSQPGAGGGALAGADGNGRGAGQSGATGGAGAGQSGATGGAGVGQGGAGQSGATGGAGVGQGGASTCTALFCEDFESGELEARKWTLEKSGANTAAVQATRVAHGKYAAQFHYAGTRDTWAFFRASALPTPLATHHFGRAYVYLTPTLPDRHTVFITAGGAGFPTHKYLEVAGQGARFQLSAVDLPADAESYQQGGSLPLMRWYCLEWEFNDSPDSAVVFVDGQQALAAPTFEVNNLTSGIVGGFSHFGVGLRAWGSGAVDATYDLYYDDIALDTQRVGCL